MRILFLSRWYPFPYDNGSKIRIFYLIKGLAKNHTIDLVSFYQDEDIHATNNPLVHLFREIRTIPYRPFASNSMKAIAGFLSAKPRSVIDTYHEAFAAAVRQMVEKNSYDLLIASEIDMVEYGRSLPIPVKIIEELEITKVLRPYQDEKRWLRKVRYAATWWKLAGYLRSMLPDYDGCTVVSTGERTALMRVNAAIDPVVIPNGVDIDLYQAAAVPAIEPDSLVYNGAITYPVNFAAVAYFIENIFPLILNQCPNAHLYVTGKSTPELLARMPPHPQVVFTGFLADIGPFLLKCSVAVVPILTGGGTRLKILESLALSIPIVSTSAGAEGLALENGKNILIADHPEDFAKGVIQLLSDAVLRENMGRNGRLVVETLYDWKQINQQFENYLARFF